MFSQSLGHEGSVEMIGKKPPATIIARAWWKWCLRLGCYLAPACSLLGTPDWQTSLSNEAPGNFPPLRPWHGKYFFGWSGFTAATTEVRFSRLGLDRCEVEGSGRTVGLARALWRYDVSYR